MSEFFDAADAQRMQEHIKREHATMDLDEEIPSLPLYVTCLVGCLVLMALLWIADKR